MSNGNRKKYRVTLGRIAASLLDFFILYQFPAMLIFLPCN